MIITTQTAYGLVLLLVFSLIYGIALSALYLLVNTLPAIVMSCKYIKEKYSIFHSQVCAYRGNKYGMIASDFFICIIAACLICSLAFIYNEGQFRFISVGFLCLGFFFGKSVFGGIFRVTIPLISYAVMKAGYVLSLPLLGLGRLGCSMIGRFVSKRVAARRLSLMKKYTKERFEKLEALTEFGLVEKAYKELIK